MRFGIIGFGKIARKFMKSITYTNGGKVVAIASKSLDENAYPDIKLYRDYDEMLCDENVDAVYIAVPHKFHDEWCIKALNHHKAVLCEKPVVLTSSSAKEIKEAAIANQTFFLEALKTKMNVSFQHLLVDLPLIGNIQSIDANFCFDGLALKGLSYLFEKDQGGALNDVGSYLIGFALEVAGCKVTNVESEAKMVDGIDEHFHATLTFENGCKATLEGAIDENKERFALIKGDKGSIMVPVFNRMNQYTITLNDGTILKKEDAIVGDDMTLQIDELIKAVHEGEIESMMHPLDEMVEVVEVTEQIRNLF